ncbi:MAG: cytochrome P460 family protein [candidate division KSB1 bacterium]|nr:cytochrome P460 family protein [candidate division KSB1 bacterium]MDZ7303725.1 cytochrome P460 family protein [candidate division KSB1 bacterium]MDZ7313138.1 cytochrome P460 family protein [candidate division KSB1 bacterium]
MSKKAVLTMIGLVAALCLSLGAYHTMAENNKVDYPEGYRAWPHVKSMVLQEGHPLYESFGGIHHVYANAKALAAMKAGKPHPDGAVLVFDLLEAKSENNAIVEGSRKVVGVMQKDSKKFAETGGWGFEAFKGDTKERVVTDAKSACFACHAGQKAQDYVFSTYRQ